MSTHNIHFSGEIRKYIDTFLDSPPDLSGAMATCKCTAPLTHIKDEMQNLNIAVNDRV